jgi:hypothetical protein
MTYELEAPGFLSCSNFFAKPPEVGSESEDASALEANSSRLARFRHPVGTSPAKEERIRPANVVGRVTMQVLMREHPPKGSLHSSAPWEDARDPSGMG